MNEINEGDWKTNSTVDFFDNKFGKIKFDIQINPFTELNNSLIFPTFLIFDDKYIENTYILKMHHLAIDYVDRKTFYIFDFKKNILTTTTFDTVLYFRQLFDKTEFYSTKNLFYLYF